MNASSRRAGVAAGVSLALVALGAPATASAQQPGHAVRATKPAASAALPESPTTSVSTPPRAKMKDAPIVVAVATLQGRGLLRGAKVQALDGKGRVLQTTTSMSGGAAVFDRAKVIGAKTIRVTGGVSKYGLRNNGVLLAPMRAYRSVLYTNFVSPVSTVAVKVGRSKGIPYARAVSRVEKHLGIPSWTTEGDRARNPNVFHHRTFARLARSEGGTRQAISALVRDVLSGSPTRLRPVNTRIAPRELTDWAGEMVITDVVQAASGETPEGAIGNLFGVENPTLSAISDVEDQLATIEAELTVIQTEMNAMLNEVEKTDYDTLVSGLGTLPSNVANGWSNYQTIIDDTELQDDSTLSLYATTWINSFGSNLGAYDALFTTTGTDGILDQLFTMNQVAFPGWWDDSIVTNVQATVDYWGTSQAQFSALLSEAWNFYGSTYTPDYISNNVNSNFAPTNGDVYATMPTTITENQIADWNDNVVLTLAAQKSQGATNSYGGDGQQNHVSSCSSLGDSHVFPDSVMVSDATAQGWWAAATPSGWTTSTTSVFPHLQVVQSVNGTSQNALATLAAGLPDAWALVTADSLPYITGWSEPKIVDGHNEGTLWYYSGWMWCNSNTVSLVNQAAKPTQWIENFIMDSGNNVPSGQSAPSVSAQIPVGVLIQQPAQFTYVNPTNLG